MRLGRKLSEGFAVDSEADESLSPTPVVDPAAPVAVEPDHDSGLRSRPAVSGATEH